MKFEIQEENKTLRAANQALSSYQCAMSPYSGSRREIEVNLLRDMIEYWGHGYYVVGDGCPPSFLHKDLEELLNGVKRYGSLDEYRNRPLNDVDDAYTNDYCPDEPGNGC